jgi:tetratricopeptide (TPR) repeat protein
MGSDQRRRVDAARWLPWLALGLLILFHAAANIAWLQQDGRSLYGDTGNHARASMAIFEALRHPGLDLPLRINRAAAIWPPVGYLLTQPLYMALGVSTDVTTFTTTLWFALAILFTYFIGRTLYDWRAGLLAAFIFSFYPAIYLQSRTYYVDMALTAMVLIALYCLLRTDDFRRRRASLWFGLALGLAALTKNAFIIMLSVPLLAVAGRGLAANGLAAWRQLAAWQPGKGLEPAAQALMQRMTNMALAGLLAALLAAPWYLSHAGFLAFIITGDVMSDVHLAAKPITWYLLKFDEALLIWPYGLLLVGLLVGLLRWRQRGNWFTLLWLAGGVALITMITRQNVRYLLPVLPAAALLSAAWIVALPSRLARSALIGITALFQIALFFAMSWGAPPAWNQALHVPVQNAHNPFNDNVRDRPVAIDPLAFLYYQYPPRPHRWPVQEITAAVVADIEASGQAEQVNRLVSLSKLLDFEYSTFAYEAALAQVQGRPGAANLITADITERDSYLSDFFDFDYVLVKSNDNSTLANRKNHRAMRDLWNAGDAELRQRFTFLRRWSLADGSTADLYKRNGPPLVDLSSQELQPILQYVLRQTPENSLAQQLLTWTEQDMAQPDDTLGANPAAAAETQDPAARARADAAVQLWRNELRFDRNNVTTWEQLVDALLAIDPAAALAEVQHGAPAESLPSWDFIGQLRQAGRRSSDLLPATQAALLRQQGRIWERLGEPQQAEQAYLAALAITPHDAAAQAAAAAFYLRQGQAEAAQAQFRSLAARYQTDGPEITEALEDATAGQEAAAAAATPTVTATTPAVSDVAALLAEQAEAAPGDAQAQARLGAWALQQGQPLSQAAEHFQRAIDLDPAMGLAYTLWANSLGNTGQITPALHLVTQGLEALPGDPTLLTMQSRWRGGAPEPAVDNDAYQAALQAGRSALGQRRWEEAVAAAQQAIELAPQRYEAQSLLGDIQRSQGDYAGALIAYQRAAELAPFLSLLYGRQGVMLARLDRPDEAIAAALTALAIDQGRWENWYALGLAYATRSLAAGSVDAEAAQRGQAYLLRARELAPADNRSPDAALAELQAGLQRAMASQAADEPGSALLDELAGLSGWGVSLEGKDAEALAAVRARADQALQTGRPAAALGIYRRLSELNGRDRVSRMGAAEALAALGHGDEALSEFGAISVDWPDFPTSYIRQGALLEAQGYVEPALAAYRAAVDAAPGNADAHFALAYALRRAGLAAEAISAFEAGLAIEPDRESARQALDALIAAGS